MHRTSTEFNPARQTGFRDLPGRLSRLPLHTPLQTNGRLRSTRINSRLRGFTLLELAVVVLILGILAGIAVQKMFDTTGDARKAGAVQTLAVLRNAIELYRSANGEFPGQSGTAAGLKSDLEAYLRGPFPVCIVGQKNDEVRVYQTGASLSPWGSEAWAYDNVTGEIIINHDSYSSY